MGSHKTCTTVKILLKYVKEIIKYCYVWLKQIILLLSFTSEHC